jgi:predicted dehydrogenase
VVRMPLRVALVGYGLAGEVFHVPLIAGTPTMELAAVVTTDPGRQAKVADRFPQARLMSSPGEIWADPSQFDLVVIASPNRTHVPFALAAVEVGLPVVVDKPIAATVADASRLRDAAGARGVPVAVFHNRRWDGDFLTLRNLLERDALGPVHRFESRFERWRPEISPTWRESALPEDAGGVLYDLGSQPHRPGAGSLRAGRVGVLRQGTGTGSFDWGSEPEERWGRIAADTADHRVATVSGRYQRFYELMADAPLTGGPVQVPIDDAIETLRVIEAAHASTS